MAKWIIEPQLEGMGQNRKEVKVKHITKGYVKDPKTGLVSYPPLPKHLTCLKLILVHESGEKHFLKVTANSETGTTTYFWQQPTKLVYRKIKVGSGKTRGKQYDSRREIDDVLSPMIEKPGEKCEWVIRDIWANNIARLCGVDLMMEIVSEFAVKMMIVNKKRAAKLAA